jgi:hypothetical protein
MLALVTRSRDALSGVGIASVGLLVPQQATHIEVISQNASPPRRVPPDRRIAPGFAARSFDVVAIEVPSNCARRFARCELCKYAPHDGGLRLDNLAIAANRGPVLGTLSRNAVAVRLASAGLSLPDAPFDPAVRFQRLDRGLALVLGRIAGIDYGTHVAPLA